MIDHTQQNTANDKARTPRSAQSTKREEDERIGQPSVDNLEPNLPFYFAGFAAAAAGSFAVTNAVGDSTLSATTLLLTMIGFVFSLGCRFLGLNLRLAELLLVGSLTYAGYQFFTGQMTVVTVLYHSQLDIAVSFAWMITIWSWTLVTDGTVLLTVVLSVAGIGLVASAAPSGTVQACFSVVLLCAMFMVAQVNYLHRRPGVRTGSGPQAASGPTISRASSARRSDQSDEVGSPNILPAQMIAIMAIAAAVVLTAGLILIPIKIYVGSTGLAQTLRGFTEEANDATLKIKTNAAAQTSAQSASDSGSLDIGTGAVLLTSQLVGYAVPSDGQPHYWRARSFDHYTGAGWTSTLTGVATIPPTPLADSSEYRLSKSQVAPGSTIIEHFDIREPTDEVLYSGDPLLVNVSPASGIPAQIADDGHLTLDGEARPAVYDVTCRPPADPMSGSWLARLRQCDTHFPQNVRLTYLPMAENSITTADDIAFFKQCLARAFVHLSTGRMTEIDRALAIRDFVAGTAVYSLRPPALAPDQDHVRSFLDTVKLGYCDMFASSMAVLCRTDGIPARIATGFEPGTFDGNRYALRDRDRHTWVEVYFNGYGWLPFDPTIGTREDASITSDSVAGSVWRGLLSYLVARGPLANGLMLAVLLIAGYIIKVEGTAYLARRAGTARGTAWSPTRQYGHMTAAIAGLGLRRFDHETPNEFALRAIPYLDKLEKSLGIPLGTSTVGAVTEYFVVHHYGSPEVGIAQIQQPTETSSQILAFVRATRKARLRLLLRRLTRKDGHGD